MGDRLLQDEPGSSPGRLLGLGGREAGSVERGVVTLPRAPTGQIELPGTRRPWQHLSPIANAHRGRQEGMIMASSRRRGVSGNSRSSGG